jgi:hypothetical protein
MAATASYRIFEILLNSVGPCLTPGVAARIAALRASDNLKDRLDELAEKNLAGILTPKESDEYSSYVEALDVIAILQAKAHKALKAAGRGSQLK